MDCHSQLVFVSHDVLPIVFKKPTISAGSIHKPCRILTQGFEPIFFVHPEIKIVKILSTCVMIGSGKCLEKQCIGKFSPNLLFSEFGDHFRGNAKC